LRRRVTGVPEEWPSRVGLAPGAIQNPAYRPADSCIGGRAADDDRVDLPSVCRNKSAFGLFRSLVSSAFLYGVSALRKILAPTTLAQVAESITGRRTILVVEDDVLVRLMITAELRERGFAVIEAATADEAIAILQSLVAVDLVFTDVQMPGRIDGLGLTAFVREQRPQLKLILTSGLISRTPAGLADGFIAKPYSPAEVIKSIDRLLEDSETRAPSFGGK
jgi:CheY-like chemotaxis protein